MSGSEDDREGHDDGTGSSASTPGRAPDALESLDGPLPPGATRGHGTDDRVASPEAWQLLDDLSDAWGSEVSRALASVLAGVIREAPASECGRVDAATVVVREVRAPAPQVTTEDENALKTRVQGLKEGAAADLLVVEATRFLISFLTGVHHDALARMVDTTLTCLRAGEALYPAPVPPGRSVAATQRREAADLESMAVNVVVAEVTTATGAPEPGTRAQVLRAITRRVPEQRVHHALSSGQIAPPTHQRILDAVHDLDQDTAARVVGQVLAAHPRGRVRSQTLFRSRLTQALARHAPQHAARVRATRLAARDCRAFLDPEGSATINITTTSPRAAAAIDRVHSLARHARANWPTPSPGASRDGTGEGEEPTSGPGHGTLSGTGRKPTLAQLRADIAADLLLYGTVTVPGELAAVTASGQTSAQRSSDHSEDLTNEVADSPIDPATGEVVAAEDPETTRARLLIGQDPPAVVHLALSIDTLLSIPDGDPPSEMAGGSDDDRSDNDDDQDTSDSDQQGVFSESADSDAAVPADHSAPGYLLGHGLIPADLARALATAPGSVWQRLLTDPVSGISTELSTTRYVPTSAIRAQVLARDPFSRFPGAVTRADRCDLDHEIPWPTGPTGVSNLQPLARRHHNLKTRKLWATEAPAGGTNGPITWTSYLGREYVTDPNSYTRPRPASSAAAVSRSRHDRAPRGEPTGHAASPPRTESTSRDEPTPGDRPPPY